MANLRAAIEHAGTALLSVGTGLPVGDLVNLTRALFGQNGPASVKSLARSVERDLTGWIDTEYGGAVAIAPALATLDDLLANHALGLRAVVEQHRMNEAGVAAAIMADGERFLAGLGQADRSLVEQLIERIYRRYLAQPELLHELSGVALRYLLQQQALNRDEFERVWRALEALTIPKPPPFSIHKPVPDFTGYEEEIARVKDALAEGSGLISTVQGIGGAGKTELARKVASEMRGDFPDGQILVDMLGTTQPRGARDAMTDVLKALGQEKVQPDTLAADYQSRLAGKRILILLDNVAERAGLDQLVPPKPAALLVTSQTRLALSGVVPVELERLSRDAAKALLAGMVQGLTDEQADGLSGLCAELPLALRVAGAYLQATGYAVDPYLDELKERRLARLAESGEDIGDASLNPAIVLGHSYERLAESDAELARLFTLLGVFPADFETGGAAAVLGLDEATARRQLGRLVQRGLVQPPAQGRWRLHDLLRDLLVATCTFDDLQTADHQFYSHYDQVLFTIHSSHVGQYATTFANASFFIWNIPNFTKALTIGRSTASGFSHLRLCGRYSELMLHIWRPQDALNSASEAEEILQKIRAKLSTAQRLYSEFLIKDLRSRIFRLTGAVDKAVIEASKAVDCARELDRMRSSELPISLSRALNNFSEMLHLIGERENAFKVCEEAILFLERDKDIKNTEWIASACGVYGTLASRLDSMGRFSEALKKTKISFLIIHYFRLELC